MHTDLEVLDFPTNYEYAMDIHCQIFDPSRDSFFISWSWIDSWLQIFNKVVDKNDEVENQIKFLIIKIDNKPVATCFCGITRNKGRSLFSCKKGYLGATGIQEIDNIYIEKNNIISSTDSWHVDINKVLSSLDVDRLSFPGVDHDSWEAISKQFNIDKKNSIISSVLTYIINLDTVRNSSSGYLGTLSSNKRHQISRTIKHYGSIQDLTIESPVSLDNALKIFDELVNLHNYQWVKKIENSSFSNKVVYDFHHDLISKSWGDGAIGIYKISNKKSVIGYIYGFFSNDTFFFYQSAFSYSDDNKVKTGLLCHALLIDHLAELGLGKYDFLAGDAQYKKSLSNNSYTMNWVDIYRYRWQCGLVKIVRQCRKKINHLVNTLRNIYLIRSI